MRRALAPKSQNCLWNTISGADKLSKVEVLEGVCYQRVEVLEGVWMCSLGQVLSFFFMCWTLGLPQ